LAGGNPGRPDRAYGELPISCEANRETMI
jgi:hypothetical protein